MNADCEKLKKEFYRCISQKQIGYNPAILNKKAYLYKDQLDKTRIDPRIMQECQNNRLVACLNKKYTVKNLDEEKMLVFFSKEYKKKMTKAEQTKQEENKL